MCIESSGIWLATINYIEKEKFLAKRRYEIMSLGNLCRREVVVVNQGTPIKEAVKFMEEKNIGSVIVVGGGKPVGIATDRDILLRVVNKGKKMSVSAKLRDYLDQNNIKYTLITHSKGYTAQELAAIMHVPGKEMAKVVILKIDGRFAMAVIPAPQKIDFERFKVATGIKEVTLASEKEFQNLFPDR